MVVDVLPIRVRSNQKSILAFCKAHRQLITYFVGFFSGDFSGFEGLPNLICNHVTFLSAPGNKFVLSLGQHKFFIYSQGAAFITAYKLPLLRFIRVLCISRYGFSSKPQQTFPCFYAAQSAVLLPPQITPIKKKPPEGGTSSIRIDGTTFQNQRHRPDTLPDIVRFPAHCRAHPAEDIASMLLRPPFSGVRLPLPVFFRRSS